VKFKISPFPPPFTLLLNTFFSSTFETKILGFVPLLWGTNPPFP